MSEKRKAKKKKKSLKDMEILPIARLILLLALAFFIVYLYYLHTKGILVSTVDSFWKKHQKMIEIISGVFVYSAIVFYLGYQKGKKR